MSSLVKSNKTTTGASALPNGMDAYIARVLADGGQIGNGNPSDYQEVYQVFKALDDAGFRPSGTLKIVAFSIGVKIVGGFVTKIYDLFSSSFDMTGNANGAAANTTLDMSTGFPMIYLPPAGLVAGQRASFRAANPFTGISGFVGAMGGFTLDTPGSSVTFHMFGASSGVGSPREITVGNTAAAADGFSRISFTSFDSGTGSQQGQQIKDKYVSRRFMGGMRDLRVINMFRDDALRHDCSIKRSTKTNAGNWDLDTHYVGLSMTHELGNINTVPGFKARFGMVVNGVFTATQFGNLFNKLSAVA